jgi:hypothetical protein
MGSKIVRIFVSSTFTDTEHERNWMMAHANPRLSNWARVLYGLTFQIVDM